MLYFSQEATGLELVQLIQVNLKENTSACALSDDWHHLSTIQQEY